MQTQVSTILHKLDKKRKLNILTCPTHESYETGLTKTGHNFYAVRGQGIKDWETKYRPLPPNYHLLDPKMGNNQLPPHVVFDLVLSQNKFGQFGVLGSIANTLQLPLISLEHTLPMKEWPAQRLLQLRSMEGHLNLFISEFSREQWGWAPNEAEVIHHGIDTESFKPSDNVLRENVCLSVVNDWINRDWCCGYRIWERITQGLPVKVLGATPGLSEPAKSTEELVMAYQSSRIFVNTSTVSPVPTALLEAAAAGCAIVSTATCMIPEIIKNGENGFISNNEHELRSNIQLLLNDEKLAKKLGEAARETVVEKFGMDKFVNNWNEILYRIAK